MHLVRATVQRCGAVAAALVLVFVLTGSGLVESPADEAAGGGGGGAARSSSVRWRPPPPSPYPAPVSASASASAAASAAASASAQAPWSGGALGADGRCAAYDALRLPEPGSGGYVIASRLGGLGNQLFQVVAATAAAAATGRTPLLAPADNPVHATVGYEASVFRHFCTAPADVLAGAAPLAQPGEGVFAYEQPAGALVPAGAGAVALSGYWQDPRYAAPLGAAGLAALLAPPPALTARLEADWGPLTSCVAVHVRRGDYVAKVAYHGYMDMTYYEAALTRAAAAGALQPGTRLLVFSDDLPWAREQEGFRSRGAIFVDSEDEVSSFYLMAACARTAIVCPNSTFCWWAAFLARAVATVAGRAAGYIAMPRQWILALSAPNIYFEGVDILDVGGVRG